MFGLMPKARFRLYKKAYLGLLLEKNKSIRTLEADKKNLQQKLEAMEVALVK